MIITNQGAETPCFFLLSFSQAVPSANLTRAVDFVVLAQATYAAREPSANVNPGLADRRAIFSASSFVFSFHFLRGSTACSAGRRSRFTTPPGTAGNPLVLPDP